MAIVNANSLQLYIGSASTRASTDTNAEGERNPIAHAQTVSLDFSNSLIDVTTKSSNSWMEKISGQRSFSLSTDGLVDYAFTQPGSDMERDFQSISSYALGAAAGASPEIYFEFGIGDSRYVGSGFIASFNQSGGTDDAPTYSISIEGNGVLTYDSDVTS